VGIACATAWQVPKIDRRKYAWDVMEHVLGGIRAIDPDLPPSGHGPLDAQRPTPWSGRVMPSATHLRVVSDDEDDDA